MGPLVFCFSVCLTVAAITTVASAETDAQTIRKLLRNYNRDDPPTTDSPTEVRLGTYINAFYSISELTMDYSVNLYLRQAWKDPRLTFDDGDRDEIKMGEGQWNEVWLPDTFMRNEKAASFHFVTVPNRLLKINSTGHVWYVVKLSLKLSCPMKLQKFPFDTQICPMMFESFGYTMDTLYYTWLDSPVDVDKGVQLPAFSLKDIILYDCSQNYSAGAFPCLEMRFMLERDLGYYIWQVYLPTMGLVVISWFTFWFPADAAVTRIILLLMSVLCLSSTAHSLYGVLPKVSYLKAIDVWMIGCSVFVYAVIIELALVNIWGEGKDKDEEAGSDEMDEGLLGRFKKSFTRGGKRAKMDKVCSVAFPLAYLLFVIIYFIVYSL